MWQHSWQRYLTHQTPRSHIWDRNAISSQRIKEHEIALLSISAPLGRPKETRNAEFLVSPKKVTWSGAAIFRMFVILPFAAGLFRKWSLLLLVWHFLYIYKNKSCCLELYLKLTFSFFLHCSPFLFYTQGKFDPIYGIVGSGGWVFLLDRF